MPTLLRRARGHGRNPTTAGAGTPPPRVSQEIREQLGWLFESPDDNRVDWKGGVIRGVRVCGLVSENGRRYTPEALRRAIPLYEGISVRVNHPKRPEEQRESEDVFGWLKNVRPDRDGALIADLHFLRSHAMARPVCEAARRNPRLYGLSHNAQGDGHYADGVFVVEEITELRSVDLVADPATNKSLYESKDPSMAAAAQKPARKTTLRKLIRENKRIKPAVRKALFEMGDALGTGDEANLLDDEYTEPAAAEEEGDWKQDLVAAIGKLVASEDPADHEMAKKVMAMLKPESASEEETTEEDEEPGKNKAEEKKAEESRRAKADPKLAQLQEQVTRTTALLAVRDLIDEAGLRFAKPEARQAFLESLLPLSDKARKALIEDRKGQAPAPAKGAGSANAPRSGPPGGRALTESQGAEVTDAKSFAAALYSSAN